MDEVTVTAGGSAAAAQDAERRRLEAEEATLNKEFGVELSETRKLGEQYDVATQRREEALKGPGQEVIQASRHLGDVASQPPPESEAAGLQYQPHKPDVQGIQNLSMASLAMAMIGGVVSKGHWMTAAGLLNGTMEGLIEGDHQRAEKEWNDFQRAFETAENHDKAAIKRMEEVRDNANLSLNAKLQEYQQIAAQYNLEPERIAASMKSHDQVLKVLQSRQTGLTTASSRLINSAASIEGAIARVRQQTQGPELSDVAAVTAAQMDRISGGKSEIVKMLSSRFGSRRQVPMFNTAIEQIQAEHPGWGPHEIAQDMVENGQKYVALTAGLRQGVQREMGVARLALTVVGMEEKIDKVARDYGLADQRWMNTPLNAVRNQLGSAKYTKLHNEIVAVARQYMEAVTMPGSNAQLHASSQDAADQMISDTMTLGQLHGAFEAFNEEIQTTGAVLKDINERTLHAIGKPGLASLFTYNAPMFDQSTGGLPAGWTVKKHD